MAETAQFHQSDTDVHQISLLNEAERDEGLSLSRPGGISHWSINLYNSKTQVLCSKVPRSKSSQCHQLDPSLPSLPFLSSTSPLWNQEVSDLPATIMLCTSQVKLNEPSLWILGCKCQLQVLAIHASGATAWGHIKLQQQHEPDVSPVSWHRTVLASLDSYFKPWKSSDATSIWQPPTEHAFVSLVALKSHSLGSEMRLLQTGTLDLVH